MVLSNMSIELVADMWHALEVRSLESGEFRILKALRKEEK